MIVRHHDDVYKTSKKVKCKKGQWESVRLLLADDNMGFSFYITTIFAGEVLNMHYKHHLESVYCISGEGELRVVADDKKHPITPGTIYALDQHDEHILIAHTEMKMACVFNPPLVGAEVHGSDGSYPPSKPRQAPDREDELLFCRC